MEARARSRFIRMSPRKVRLVIDLIRGRSVDESMKTLQFVVRAAKEPVEKTLRSAVANIFNNTTEGAQLETSDLYVKEAFVDEGPTMKRFRARAMGRANREAGVESEERFGSEGTSNWHEARDQQDLEVQMVR